MDSQPLILIVDDEPFNIAVLEQELDDLDYATITAANGQQALDLVASSSPDLILLDIMMPVMDGFSVLSQLKTSAATRDIPVIVISALSDIGSIVTGIERGAEDYLPKPFDPVLLQARIGACLERKRLRDQELDYLRQVERLTTAASDVEANVYDPESLEPVINRADGLGNLARVFQRMAREVHIREQRLRHQLEQAQLDLEERQQARGETAVVYIPMDRRQAIAAGGSLPEQASGAALFVDVSGFTTLTEVLARELGAQRGAEELIRRLNQVFAALTDEVQQFRGSVVSFAGDAMTAWFDADDGLRATACAMSLQQVMERYATVTTPLGSVMRLAVRVAVAAGTVHRLLVGDPHIQVIDTLAGRVIDALATGDRLASNGEVVVQAAIAEANGEQLEVTSWRIDPVSGDRFAIVAAVEAGPVAPWPELARDALDDSWARPWLLPTVYERVREGKSEFLAELRPVAALFLGFGGIEFGDDDQPGARLDAFVSWVQGVVATHGGALLQVTTGDKGGYLYAAFGAPVAHEDDAVRAVAAAFDLLAPPPDLGSITNVRIATTFGQMRAGAYGGPQCRTYGVQGSTANLAAHLMQYIPDGIVCDEAIYRAARSGLAFTELPPVTLKGHAGTVSLFRPLASTMQSVVSSRLDRLPAASQRMLKIASVIGMTFTTDLLHAIHPIETDRQDVDIHLDAAATAGLLVRRSDESEAAWAFPDSVTHDEAYGLLLFAQRRRLHRAVAEWHEQRHADNLVQYYPVLAHHWNAADEPAKASSYLELAGVHARDQGAADVATRYFRASLDLATQTYPPGPLPEIGMDPGGLRTERIIEK